MACPAIPAGCQNSTSTALCAMPLILLCRNAQMSSSPLPFSHYLSRSLSRSHLFCFRLVSCLHFGMQNMEENAYQVHVQRVRQREECAYLLLKELYVDLSTIQCRTSVSYSRRNLVVFWGDCTVTATRGLTGAQGPTGPNISHQFDTCGERGECSSRPN